MKEVDLQLMICDVVNDRGGYARKLSHRFLNGISDLLVKLPGYPATKIEVKQRISAGDDDREFKLTSLTKLQKDDLLGAQAAGLNSGVFSFIQTKAGLRTLYGVAIPIRTLERDDYTINVAQHVFMGKPDEREERIWQELNKIAKWQPPARPRS
jgi:hypothetical protein